VILQAWFIPLAVLFSVIGSCTAWHEYVEKIDNADIRAEETRRAVEIVRRIGEEAELQLKDTRRIPTREELNCESKPCEPYTFLTKFVTIDSEGIIHAEYHNLGYPFSPARQFKVYWDSRTRKTNRDRLVESWQWKLSYLSSLVFSIGIIAIPWILKIGHIRILRFRARNATKLK
jgi:hypothetical protein